MEAHSVLEIVTSTWGLAMAMSPAMQIRRMLQTRTSEDVSIGYFGVLVVGFLLWVLYGMSIGSKVLWVCNSVAFVFASATIIVALRLRARART